MALARPLRFGNDGWLVGVNRRPGPSWKQSGTRPRTTGGVSHSMEGWKAGGLAVLMGSRAVSWQGSIYQSGEMDQHYSIQTWCWHARGGNSWLWGFEYEGRTGIPLTRAQLLLGDELYDAYQDYALRLRVPGWEHWARHKRTAPWKNAWEHNEVPTSATACPSERMMPMWPLIVAPRAPTPEPPPEEEDELTMGQYEELKKGQANILKVIVAVGEVVRENAALGVMHTAQINFLIKSLVKHHNNGDLHTEAGDAIDSTADDPTMPAEIIQLKEKIEEIEARMIAGVEALSEAIAPPDPVD